MPPPADAAASRAWWARTRPRTQWLPPALAAVLAAAYGLVHPPAADLAAQTARAELVERVGPVIWWTRWYGGIETPGYGIVSPSLMAWLGVTTVGVLGLLATGLLAPPLLRRAPHPLAGATALVVMQAVNLWAGRTTFALGVAAGLGALLAVDRGVAAAGVALSALATLSSPVAGLLLGVPLGVQVLLRREGRVAALAAGVAALAVLGGVALLFPAGGNGEQPFAGWLLRDCLVVTAVVALLPVGRAVRLGAALTAVLLVAAFVVPSAVGSNASRMPLLFAAPAVAAAARLPRPLLLAATVLVGLFPADQLRDDLSALDASRTTEAYYAPLLAALAAEPAMRTHRVEIVEPRDHWHAARVAPHFSLARGWQRQADVERTTPLYRPEPLAPTPLTAESYRAWLDRYAVAMVAVAPDAPVDFASVQERTLVLGGLPYLEDAGRHGAWQLYRVRDAAPLADGVAEAVAVTDDAVVLRAGAAGSARVRVWWSPYLVVSGPPGATAVRDGELTRVDLPAAGEYRLHARFRLPPPHWRG